jgi:hypothetical protein
MKVTLRYFALLFALPEQSDLLRLECKTEKDAHGRLNYRSSYLEVAREGIEATGIMELARLASVILTATQAWVLSLSSSRIEHRGKKELLAHCWLFQCCQNFFCKILVPH